MEQLLLRNPHFFLKTINQSIKYNDTLLSHKPNLESYNPIKLGIKYENTIDNYLKQLPMKIFALNAYILFLIPLLTTQAVFNSVCYQVFQPTAFYKQQTRGEWCWQAVTAWHNDKKKSDCLVREQRENLKHRTVQLSGIIILRHQQILMSIKAIS